MLQQRLINYASSLILLLVVYCLYSFTPYYQNYFSTQLNLFSIRWVSWNIVQSAFLIYGFCLLIYYLLERSPQPSKSIYCLQAFKKIINFKLLWQKELNLTAEEKLGLLCFLLKAFFAPLMVAWLFIHISQMLINGSHLIEHFSLLSIDFLSVFNQYGFWFLLKVILFLDVVFFTIGYLIELPGLKNTIRSVDATILGWVAALACYPPFNGITSKILGWEPVDFPQFDNEFLHIIVNSLLLILMAFYTSASVALNFKASNLTHRGIIAHGPYRVIRHPAYICKNMAWWLAALPALIHGIESSDLWSIILLIASVSGWSLIYVLRALTEEDHLKRVDQEYDQYCQQVKYRFIPGIY